MSDNDRSSDATQDATSEMTPSQCVQMLCEQYEQEWQDGKAPDLGEYYRQCDVELRHLLLVRLTLVDSSLRRRAGGEVTAELYIRQFPEHESTIRRLFRPRATGLEPRLLADRNLMQGVLALQLDYIDQAQFVDVCSAWMLRKDQSLGQLLLERGWLTQRQFENLEKLISDRLAGKAGDPTASLMDLLDESLAEVLREVDGEQIRLTLEAFPPQRLEQLEAPDLSSRERTHYHLTRVHKSGGQARVWLAYDQRLHRRVALKEPRPDKSLSEAAMRRFLQEAQIAGQLEHPNIVPVYELIRLGNDPPFYTMRFLQGQSLRAAIAEYHKRREQGKAGSLELHGLLESFVAVCNAMSYAHARGVLHRDLKPDNVVLGAFGEVNLLDWGLAKRLDRAGDDEATDRYVEVSETPDALRTRPGSRPGTPPYWSLEQAAGQVERINRRTDIYGLGTILFEILAGRPPHAGQDTQRIRDNIIHGPTPRARDAVGTVPRPLDAICAKAMSKDQQDRYATVHELSQDVRRWLADEPVRAYQERLSERAARWMRRHRVWTQAVGTALLIVAVVATIAAVSVERARRHEHQAKLEAIERLQQSLHTIDTMLTGVERVAENYPGARDLRIPLLSKAAEQLADLAARPTSDPGLLAETARCELRLGEVHLQLSELKSAEDVLRRAVERVGGLPDELLGRLENQITRVAAHRLLAEVLALQGHSDQAQRQLETAETLAAGSTQPGDAGMRLEAARTFIVRAQLRQPASELDAALADLQAAEDQLRPLLSIPGPTTNQSQELLALVHTLAGQLLAAGGRNDTAQVRQEGALQIYQQLAAGDAAQPRYQEGLAFARFDLANTLAGLGDVDAEEKQLRQAASELAGLVDVLPDVPRYQDNLAAAHSNLGRLLHRTARFDEADKQLNEALRLLEKLANGPVVLPHYLEQLAQTCSVLGRLLIDQNRPEAWNNLESARLLYEQLLRDDDPQFRPYRLGLAATHRQLARLHQREGQTTDADKELTTALELLEQLLAEADDRHTREELAWCLELRGDDQRQAGDELAAQSSYQQALDYRQPLPDLPEYRYEQIRLQLKVGAKDLAALLQRGRALAAAVPANGKYRTLLSQLELAAGNHDQARHETNQVATTAYRADPIHLFVQALALAQRQPDPDLDRARAAYDAGLQLLPAAAPGDSPAEHWRRQAAEALGIGGH
ncbi:MAG: serine/threonine protein kinase [Pirellulaceae bacterium]|nr:serine/threonine protein kinase [Pirellulaceae bacterium]